jgi:hypothetical protein
VRRRRVRPGAAAAIALLAGCASAPPAAQPAAVEAVGDTAGAGAPAPFATAGTLRHDDVTVSLRAGALLIKVTPLGGDVTRLLAPDTGQRLNALAASHMPAARSAAAQPILVLVSFFSQEPDAGYDSGALELTQLGRLHRPSAVLPVTPGFGAGRLRAQETQLAVYVFAEPLDLEQPLMVRYGTQQSDAWSRIIPRLEQERARLLRGGSRIP